MEKNYVRQHLRSVGIFSDALCALHSDKDGFFQQKDAFFNTNVFSERFQPFYIFL